MISNQQAIALLQAITRISAGPGNHSTKFYYALIRNKKQIEEVVKAYEEAINAHVDPNFRAWQDACNKMRTDYAAKDEHGAPVMHGADGLPMVVGDQIGPFNAACEKLALDNPEWKTAVEARVTMLNELLMADAKIDPYKMKLADLPENLSARDVEDLYVLIEE